MTLIDVNPLYINGLRFFEKCDRIMINVINPHLYMMFSELLLLSYFNILNAQMRGKTYWRNERSSGYERGQVYFLMSAR